MDPESTCEASTARESDLSKNRRAFLAGAAWALPALYLLGRTEKAFAEANARVDNHTDGHYDGDNGHSDRQHIDNSLGHRDQAHQDVGHSDGGVAGSHYDCAHFDAEHQDSGIWTSRHLDVAFSDIAAGHGDLAHYDVHKD